MVKTRPPYTPEFRRQMVELVHAGRSPEKLAAEFEPTAQSIRNWVAQAERDAGRRTDGVTSEEREELRRLRREVKTLREEREILKNESGTRGVPPARRETRGRVGWAAREERPSASWCS